MRLCNRVTGPIAGRAVSYTHLDVYKRQVEKVYQAVDEEALIEEWIRRKYRTATREGLFGEQKDLAAAYGRLARAGFRSGEILKVLKRFAKNPDLLDGFEAPQEENDL